MRYRDFLARYRRAYDAWGAGDLDAVGAAEEIERLRALIASIEEPDRHQFAEAQLGQWTRQLSPQTQDRVARAASVLTAAGAEHGTDAERLDRARQGRVTITAIADETTDDGERHVILAMNEPLSLLIDSLEARR